ncbi:hypothetical protein [Wenzhouxiangella sp. XN79A]|uniref:hypothetical protein n=1 Tax=Wenzhouxiangella sp. XN79A TaxID=2724193 RepID=UPI00197FE2B1|nr:hypothetical protein [Wenzhouxiangella sp. XN79A]
MTVRVGLVIMITMRMALLRVMARMLVVPVIGMLVVRRFLARDPAFLQAVRSGRIDRTLGRSMTSGRTPEPERAREEKQCGNRPDRRW